MNPVAASRISGSKEPLSVMTGTITGMPPPSLIWVDDVMHVHFGIYM